MKLYSTLDRKIVQLETLEKNILSMYCCGPTVYSRMHIGNIRAYVNWDILHRALLYLGYDVKRVMNMTDVGHMTADEDFGEDKLQNQAEKEGTDPLEIANKYIDSVLKDFRALNILAPNGKEIPSDLTYEDVEEYGWTRATSYIDEMIDLVKRMEENGYTYETEQAVYFDVTKLPDYTIFTGQNLDEKSVGAREEVGVDPDKKHPADFVLWMKRTGKYAKHIMHWDSPWGDGFPGWHIECSAMSTAILGEQFDIHTGGVDHIPVHHANERAQNIGAFKHPVVKYWVHNEWLVNAEDDKLSKTHGASTLPEVLNLGFDEMDVRYLFMSINYHTRVQYSVSALEGAKNARLSLVSKVKSLGTEKGSVIDSYKKRFEEILENNLNMSDALALVNELLKSDEKDSDKLSTILDFDKVFGLDVGKAKASSEINIYLTGTSGDEKVDELLEQRKQARENREYEESDRLRDEILKLGYKVLDTQEGQTVEKI